MPLGAAPCPSEQLGLWWAGGNPVFEGAETVSLQTGGAASTRDPASRAAPAAWRSLRRSQEGGAPSRPSGKPSHSSQLSGPRGRRRAPLPAGTRSVLKGVSAGLALVSRSARRRRCGAGGGAWSCRGPAEHRSAGSRRHGERGPGVRSGGAGGGGRARLPRCPADRRRLPRMCGRRVQSREAGCGLRRLPASWRRVLQPPPH